MQGEFVEAAAMERFTLFDLPGLLLRQPERPTVTLDTPPQERLNN